MLRSILTEQVWEKWLLSINNDWYKVELLYMY